MRSVRKRPELSALIAIIPVAADQRQSSNAIVEVIDMQLKLRRLEQIDFIRAAGAESAEVVGTNYERKYIKAGRPVHTIAARKL